MVCRSRPQRFGYPAAHDPCSPNPEHPDYAQSAALAEARRKPVVFQISRKEGDEKKTLDIPVEPAYHYTVGLRMRMGQITAVRDDSPAAKARQLPAGAAGIQARSIQRSMEGDILDEVEVADSKNGKIVWTNAGPGNAPAPGVTVKILDPVRLPDELAKWADTVARSWVTLTVLKGRARRARKFDSRPTGMTTGKTIINCRPIWDRPCQSWSGPRLSDRTM